MADQNVAAGTLLAPAPSSTLVRPAASLPHTYGVPVLEADAEVDRREVTVAVALRAAAGSEATVTVLGPPCFSADGMPLPRSAQVGA